MKRILLARAPPGAEGCTVKGDKNEATKAARQKKGGDKMTAKQGGLRKQALTLMALCLLTSLPGITHAYTVDLYVDSAPNVYGSTEWAPWWTDTKADASDGDYANMGTGTYPNSLVMDPYDEIVYSTGDLGKRLHWIYWIPGETKESLSGLFEVKWVIDWGGEDWTLVSNSWALDSADAGWVEPSSWEDYSSGVIGSFGFAWWAIDDDAAPGNTDGNPYNEVDQADIDALRQVVFASQTYAKGMIRFRDSTEDEWQYAALQVNMVPWTVEVCDGLDNDLDGEVDEDLVGAITTCGVGSCAAKGLLICVDGQAVDTCTLADGSPEVCDGVDNDCNGEVDDGLSTDADGDGHYSLDSCLTPADDCDDSDPSVHPGATEGPITDITDRTCFDRLDNDCDGLTDRDDSDCALPCGTLPTAGSGKLGQMGLLLIPLAQIFLMKTLRRRKN